MNESQVDKLQHEMYWNISRCYISIKRIGDKLQHEMYWNLAGAITAGAVSVINYNMRCIETRIQIPGVSRQVDKLQHEMYWNEVTDGPSGPGGR